MSSPPSTSPSQPPAPATSRPKWKAPVPSAVAEAMGLHCNANNAEPALSTPSAIWGRVLMLHPQYSRGTLLRKKFRLFRILAFVLGVHYNDKRSGRDFFFFDGAQAFGFRVCLIGGVPYWGPYYQGILLFGGLNWGSPAFVNPHMLSAHMTPSLPRRWTVPLSPGRLPGFPHAVPVCGGGGGGGGGL